MLCCNYRVGSTIAANSTNYVVSEHRSMVLCPQHHHVSAPAMPAPLSGHIGHVVLMRTEEQMRRVAARRVVTPMKNKKPLQDRTFSQNPSKPVRENVLEARKPHAPIRAHAVFSEPTTAPLPALVRFTIQPRKKALAKIVAIRHTQNVIEIHRATPRLGARTGSSVASTLPSALTYHTPAFTQAAFDRLRER